MHVRIKSPLSAALIIAGLAAAPQIHARTVEVQTAWCPGSETTSIVEVSPQESILALKISGGIRTVPAGGILDLMTGTCLASISNVGGKRVGVGNCVWMDKDGDKIVFRFHREAPSPGKGEVIAGTGKFAGAQGSTQYSVQSLAGPAGAMNMCIDGSFKLQLP